MPQDISNVYQYSGSLAAVDLLSGSNTILLNAFGPSETGTVNDDDGILSTADDGTTTYNGVPINYIGSGTVQPGVNVGGLIVGLGAQKDVVIFEAGGTTYFHYPDGPPNITGAVALVVDIDSSPHQVYTPVCFAKGTLIRTPEGDLPIEELSVGDLVFDRDGAEHEIQWIGRRHLHLARSAQFDKWNPVRISRNTFGDGCPYVDTYLSQQHRICVASPQLELLTGSNECLVAARLLTNDTTIRIDRSRSEITYLHILCEEHVILIANGMEAESMSLGPTAMAGVTQAGRQEITALFPELEMPLALPALKQHEAALLIHDWVN
jgi:hypothetical protein